MRRHYRLIAFLIAAVLLPIRAPAQDSGRIAFKVTLAKSVGMKGATGRLLVFMSNSPQKPAMLDSGFIPGSVWIAATEVEWLAAGQSVTLDPDAKSFPKPFSKAVR